MPHTAKVIKGASGFIVKHCGKFFRIPKKFIKSGDEAADVAERLANSKITLSDLKTISARGKLLGKTPGKLDKTGQHVWRRMAEDGQLFDGDGLPLSLDDYGGKGSLRNLTDGDLDEIYVRGKDGPVPLRKCDMGHKEGAVDFWVDRGHTMSPEKRKQWMLDLEPPPAGKNYEFQPRSENRAAGARNPNRYSDVDPTTHTAEISGWN